MTDQLPLPGSIRSVAFGAAFVGLLCAAPARAQCPDPVAGDFRLVTLANNANNDLYGNSNGVHGNNESGSYGVVAMDVAPDGKVFIAKMCTGDIMVYTPTETNPATTVRAGTVPTKCNNEDGLLGVAVDPSYPTTGWIYAFHTDAASVDFSNVAARNTDARLHTLTRYTYVHSNAPGSRLTNPKVILQFPRIVDDRAYHAAGGIDITPDGVMVIGTGDDTNPHGSGHCPQNNGFGPTWSPDPGCDGQRSSANTNDLRGKLLRIRPIPFPDTETPAPGLGTTYNVPPGNLWEFINAPAFNPNWNPAQDTVAKVRREVYTMGHRNPYHPRIDGKSGWIFTGEVGPDARNNSGTRGPHGMEEWNLAVGPGFYGHPYCIADNQPWNALTSTAGSGTWGAPYNCAAVQNTSPNNTGIRNLPPAKEAHLFYSHVSGVRDNARMGNLGQSRTAVGGPMYRYDTALASNVKFPPQYEGKIFFFDWANANKASFRIINVNPNGTLDAGAAATPAFPGASLLPNGSYIDMRFGKHDGAMYVLRGSNSQYSNFNQAALYRIEYTGTINNACYSPFVHTVGPVSIAGGGRPEVRRAFASPRVVDGLVTLPVGYRTVTLYDLSGRKVWSHTRASSASNEAVRVPADLAAGLLQARFTP